MTANVLRKPSARIAPYWGMLRELSIPMKLELVVLLNESIEETNEIAAPQEIETPKLSKEERKRKLMALAGCWADDPEDAARMEAAVKSCRENDVLREVNMD